ncbi:MAG: CPBP family intramembrane metalloprotease, partial [Lachnospiraceae bacterium]|nr:CPBP family intramembrane metalloprotease [Lachnospiraceae bacterium]
LLYKSISRAKVNGYEFTRLLPPPKGSGFPPTTIERALFMKVQKKITDYSMVKAVIPSLVYILISTFCFAMAMALGIDSAKNKNYILAIEAVIGIVVFSWWYKKDINGSSYRAIGCQRKVACLITAVIFGLLVCLMTNYLFDLTGLNRIPDVVPFNPFSDSNNAVYVVYSVLLAPVYEELVFRGFVYRRAREGGVEHGLSYLLSALLFALIHGDLIQGLYAFIIAFFLCMVYNKIRMLCAPILLHVSANALAMMDICTGFITNNTQKGHRLIIVICSLLMMIVLSVIMNRFVQTKEEER